MFSYPITAKFHANAPPEAVWAAFEAVERWPEVLEQVGDTRIEPPGPLVTGAVIRSRSGPPEAPVEIEYRVALAEPPRRLTLETDTLDWNGRTDYTIEPDDSGSRVTVVSTMEVIGTLLRVQMFVVGRTLNAQRDAALRARTQALLTLAERLAQQT